MYSSEVTSMNSNAFVTKYLPGDIMFIVAVANRDLPVIQVPNGYMDQQIPECLTTSWREDTFHIQRLYETIVHYLSTYDWQIQLSIDFMN